MTQLLERTLNEAAGRLESQHIVRELRAVQPGIIKSFERVLLPMFDDLGERVVARGSYLFTSRFFEAKWKSNLTRADAHQLVEDIITASQLRAWAGDRLTPAFWANYEAVMNQTARVLIRAGLASNTTQATINRLLANGGRRAGLVDVVGDTRKALFRVIEQGIDAGLSPRQTAQLMRDIVPEGRFVNAGAGYRASLIARTETLHAQRLASIDRYRENRIRYLIAYDGDFDATCLMRNGQTYTVDEAYDETLNTHPQCVLSFGPISGV